MRGIQKAVVFEMFPDGWLNTSFFNIIMRLLKGKTIDRPEGANL